jgi:hypothetical protein
VSILLDEEKEETIQGSRESNDCRHQEGDAGAKIDGVGPRRSEIPSRVGRRGTASISLSGLGCHMWFRQPIPSFGVKEVQEIADAQCRGRLTILTIAEVLNRNTESAIQVWLDLL